MTIKIICDDCKGFLGKTDKEVNKVGLYNKLHYNKKGNKYEYFHLCNICFEELRNKLVEKEK